MPERVHRVVLQADVSGFKRSMTEAADATKKIGSASEESSDKGSSAFDKLGGMAGKVLGGAAIAGAAKAILDVGLSYEKSLNSMQAVTSATGAEMDKVSALAKQLGNDINIPGASASDAAEAMTELAKGGLNLQESMAAAKGTLQLATAAQISGAEAATIQADALNSFNLEASDAGRVADVLANAANSATGDISDFGQGLAQVSAVANAAGFSIEETTTFLAMFANAGLKGSDAGTSLKTMITSLQNPSEQAAGAMEELGLSVYDAEGNMVEGRVIVDQLAAAQGRMSQQAFNAAAGTVFGSDAIRAAAISAQAGAEGFDKAAAALTKVGGASDLAKAQAQGLPGAFANIKNQAESVAISLYEQVGPSLEAVLNAAADALPAVGDFFGDVVEGAAGFVSFIDDLPGPVKTAAAALTAIAIVKNPVTETFTSISDKLSDFKAKVDEAASATSPLVESVAPLGEALGTSGEGADKLAEGLAAAAEKAAESKAATDAAKDSATPLGESLGAAGEGAAVLGEALAGAADQSSATAAAAGEATAATDPLTGALEGAGLSADALGEGLSGASEKAKEIKGSGAGAAGALHKVGAAAKVAGAGLLTAFGGPVGVAITAVSVIVSQVGSDMSDLELATNDFSGAVDELSGKVAAARVIELIPPEQVEGLREAGVELGLYANALTGVPGAQERVTQLLFASAKAHGDDFDAVARSADLYKQFVGDLNGVGTAQDAFTDKQRAVIDLIAQQNASGLWPTEKADAYGKSLQAIAEARGLDTVTQQVNGLGSAMDGAARAVAAAGPVQEDINKAWEDGSIDASELGKQVSLVMQRMDELAGRNGDAEAAQRAFNSAAVEYNKLILDQSLAGNVLAEAEARVAQAQTDRTEIQGKATDSTYTAEQKTRDLERADRDTAQATVDLAKVQQDQKLAGDELTVTTDSLKSAMLTSATAAVNSAVRAGNVAGAHEAAAGAVQQAKDAFIAMQSPADIASGKAQQLADKLFGIPANVATTVVAETLTAQQRLDAIQGSIASMTKSVTIRVQAEYTGVNYGGSVGKAVDDATAMIGRADGGMFQFGQPVEHAANGMSRMVKGGANLVHWAEPETVWEAFISGKPSQRGRNHAIMGQAATKLGGTYIPPGNAPQRFANGGLNVGAQPSFMGSNTTNNTTSGPTYQISVTNTASRPLTVDDLIRVTREAERRRM